MHSIRHVARFCVFTVAALVFCIWLTTTKAHGQPTTFAIVGDYGAATTGSTHAAIELSVANLIHSWNPDYVLTTGDNNYESGEASTIDANIGQFYQQYIGNYTGAYGPGAGNGAGDNRFFPSLGNHDWTSLAGRTPDGSPQAYVDYFTLPGPGYTSTSGNERYYDFQIGDMRFFAYDSDSNEPHGIAAGSTQANWLQAQLAASTAKWNFVYMHHPPYSSGVHGNTPAVQLPYKAWGADAVFTGHDHDLERIIIGGLPYFVSGAGGKVSRLTSGQIGGSEFLNDIDNGALRMTVDDNVATFEFFSVANGGTLLDTFVIDKTQQALSTTLSFQQNVNGYAGTVDTYLAQSAPNTSYATATQVNVDSDDPSGTGQDNHVLLRFDNIFGSAAGQIPYNAKLLDATLSLTTTNAGNGATLHRMLATWPDTLTWTTAGSGIQANDIEAVAAADTSSGTTGIGTSIVDVLTSLEAWHDDPSSNFGWAFLPVGNDGWDFYTAEGATPPRLDVTLVIAIDGDANFDGQVNALDLSILAANWLTSAKWAGGDFNADGFVNALDLSVLAANWLNSASGAAVSGGSFDDAVAQVGLAGIPEPTTALLLGCPAVLLLLKRRREPSGRCNVRGRRSVV